MTAFVAAWDATGDGGQRLTTIFGVIGFLVLAAGMGISAYRVSVTRRRARDAGQSPNVAMLRALKGEDDDTEDLPRDR
jgi:hypothetical protein